jgi:hypothetical protein
MANNDKGKPDESQGRKATGPRPLQDVPSCWTQDRRAADHSVFREPIMYVIKIAVLTTVAVLTYWTHSASADEMVQVDAFCIDKYEASLTILPSSADLVAVSALGVLPAVNISQIDAAAACAQAGKRLCSDAEWLRACQGPDNYTYPYGNTLQPAVCNDNGSLAATGIHSECVSAEGAFDLVGNVNEWTFDPNGTARGGFFLDSEINGPGCLYRTTAHSVLHADLYTGFRCCSDECASSNQVNIDVKPGSDPNCFSINGHGVIPVAILGNEGFDVADIDQSSLLFGGLDIRVRGKKGPLCGFEDSNSDGFTDLVCQFEDDASNWDAGEENATLTGVLIDGQQIEGSDSICVVP